MLEGVHFQVKVENFLLYGSEKFWILKHKLKNWRLRTVIVSPNISNYYGQLALGFSSINRPVLCYFMGFNRYEADCLKESKFLNLSTINETKSEYCCFVINKMHYFVQQFIRFIWLITVGLTYHNFVFGYGHTLLFKNLDLLILKIFGKKVVVIMAHGSEARPAYLDGAFCFNLKLDKTDLRVIKKRTKNTYMTVKRIQNFTKYVIGHPNNFHFARKKFINMEYIGQPVGVHVEEIRQKAHVSKEQSSRIRVIHAPSQPETKGSTAIRLAVESMQDLFSIDFIELRGLGPEEVKAVMKSSDLLIDQIYADAPVSGVTLEAASYGIPSVILGYYPKADKSIGKVYPPVIHGDPEQLVEVIEKCFRDSAYREWIGKSAKIYVEQFMSPKSIATRLSNIFAHDIPETWWLNNESVEYLYGYGQTKQRTKQIIQLMTLEFGHESLRINHNRKLLGTFKQFINQGKNSV